MKNKKVLKSSLKSHKKGVIWWFTGNTGAGKTTALRQFALIHPSIIQLDGDEIRDIYPTSLSEEDRKEHCLRVAKLANMFAEQGHDVGVAVIAPYQELRQQIKKQYDVRFVYVEGGANNTSITPYEAPQDEISYRIKRK